MEQMIDEPTRRWAIAVLGTDPIPRQTQMWVNAEVERLCSKFVYEHGLNADGKPTLLVIPCHTGMAAALWAGPRNVDYEVWLPWTIDAADLPISLDPRDPFVANPDGRFMLAGASEVHTLSPSKEQAIERMLEARRRVMHESDLVMVTHDSRKQKIEPFLIRATQERKAVVVIDWRKKKSYLKNKELLPDAEPDPF